MQRLDHRTSNILSISDEDLIRHPDIAFEDGYADARTWGSDGFFISSRYSDSSRLRYLKGFKAGLRVHSLYNTVSDSTSLSKHG